MMIDGIDELWSLASKVTSVTCHSTGSPVKVLHIDDEESFLELVKLYLENLSDCVKVTSASSTSQFFSLLDESSYDIIISDYHMPGMNGLELLLETRKRGVESPFILLTGEKVTIITSQALNYHGISICSHYRDQFRFHESLGIVCYYQCRALNFAGVDYYLYKNGNICDLFSELLYFINSINEKRSKHLKDLYHKVENPERRKRICHKK
ncbi:MAG: response regulator [Candidatus Odinarchaeota archaeon]